ncbi:MAG: CPBP family intramembrane glutamic endopeptidase [Cyanobacteria bacterium P01_F01_bin.150]
MGVTAIVLLVIARLILYFSPVSMLALGWTPQHVGIGIALGAGITSVSGIVYRFWPAYRKSANVYLEMVLPTLVWPDLLWLGLLPGLSEELLFRGALLPIAGLNILGLIVTSLLFGVMHFSGIQQWPYIVWASIVGIVLGWSAIATHGLLVPIIAHITTNIISSCLWKWKHRSLNYP